MAAPRRSSTLRGSKAAPGPSKKSFERAANRGAFNAGKNYTAKGVSRTGLRPTATPKPSPTPARRGTFSNAADAVSKGLDALKRTR